ncbi:hypothetical protein CLV24_10411 [Pontibacter ummariensis]|uniref:Uncharacterized protein n=1 Tax=Pontibacter ummariensis TaxID=1610492 RepID=A0A239D285_9BACT|nr:hypothetical protein [Pontibacter ummariensis]PRY14201.1 hypothetical protein CLV24_10411 [Pontibacter ummariensis]SNS26329.1 hypothetical protein SAMN06296052_10411 [Pontibacter ummariensis]
METPKDLKDKAKDVTEKANRFNPEHREGKVASTIEEYTSRLPSDVYLWAAFGSIAASLVLKMMDKDKTALFVGQWAPTFLILGNYNKIVKVQGHD